MGLQTQAEQDKYRELYAKIVFALDEIHDFLSEDDLKRRRFVRLLPVLKNYSDMLDESAEDEKKAGIFGRLFHKSGKSPSVGEYRRRNADAFLQLEDCARCKCLNCVRDCKMEGCSRCEPGHGCRVASCDNKESAVWTYGFKSLDLQNNATGRTETFEVKAVVQDLAYKQRYIILENNGGKIVLYYYPGLKGDDYGEVTDADDLNFAVKAYENRDL